jgi:hypothetical protein
LLLIVFCRQLASTFYDDEEAESGLLFDTLAARLRSTTSFGHLEVVCKDIEPTLPPLYMDNFSNVRFDRDAPDTLAKILTPSDCGIKEPYCVRTSPDGSCFLHAASRMIFGHERRDTELRVRLVVEGVCNKERYLDETFLRIGAEDIDISSIAQDVVSVYALLCGQYDAVLTSNEEVYKSEMFHYRLSTTYSSMWQFHQLACVLQRPVMSVYPYLDGAARGHNQMRDAYHRLIQPPSHNDRRKPYGVISWTVSDSSRKSPNHFVYVVP